MKISQAVIASNLIEVTSFDDLALYHDRFVNIEVIDKRSNTLRVKRVESAKIHLVDNPSVVQGFRRIYVSRFPQSPKWDVLFKEDTAFIGSAIVVRLEVLL